MKNRKLALVITLVCALLLCGVSTGLAAKNTIKIGYFSDMSSADGYIGMAGYYALLDRAEELNANGGLLGKQIEVIGYDNTAVIVRRVDSAAGYRGTFSEPLD